LCLFSPGSRPGLKSQSLLRSAEFTRRKFLFILPDLLDASSDGKHQIQ
jgi:hypothetical protein